MRDFRILLATFEQAVAASKNAVIEDAYAKCILFDYSYRYFYEDGFGKDYQILNLPESGDKKTDIERIYLTACLLKFYQQLRIYEQHRVESHHVAQAQRSHRHAAPGHHALVDVLPGGDPVLQ